MNVSGKIKLLIVKYFDNSIDEMYANFGLKQ